MSFTYFPHFGFIFPSFPQSRNHSCKMQKKLTGGGVRTEILVKTLQNG